MKKLLWFAVFCAAPLYAADPRNPFPNTPDQVWQDDLDLSDQIDKLSSDVAAISTIPVASVNCASVTCEGAVFNGPNQLAQYGGNGVLTVSTLSVTNTQLQISGNQSYPILQIVQYTINISSTVNTTNFSYTNLSGGITPHFSSSKILVHVSGVMACTGSGICYATLARNGTNLASSTGGFVDTAAAANVGVSMDYYDSPGSTSAVPYEVQLRTNGAGAGAVFPGTDGGSFTTTAVLQLTEIAQ